MDPRKPIVVLVTVMAVFVLFSACPYSDAADTQHPQYTGPDGSVYYYETYGSGSTSSPYRSTIFGYVQGDADSVRIQSALEGYQVTAIAEKAFSGTDISYAIIPERVSSIGSCAFSECEKLTDVYFLGDLPSEMASDAFSDDVTFHYLKGKSGWQSYLDHNTEIIPSSTVTMADKSVAGCILAGSDVIVTEGRPNSAGTITIPSEVMISGVSYDVTSLGAWIFYDRSDVIDVTIQPGIREISERAFYKCASLVNVNVPDSVTVIMDEAFRECFGVNNITMANVEFIGFEAFRMCYAFTSISVPDTVTFIGEGAFRYCTSATSVVLSSNLTEITPWMLDGCYLMGSIMIPKSVTSIGDYAFHLCRLLSEITIPGSVESIGDDAFLGCESLTDAYFEGNMPEMGKDVFKDVSEDFEIHQGKDNGIDSNLLIIVVIAALVIVAVLYLYMESRRANHRRT